MHDHTLEKKGQNPLYLQLMMRLKNDMIAGIYPPSGKIPSEQILCETYHVSRVTVRKALLELVLAGLLVRRQGKGTFVADKRLQRDLQSISSFSYACGRMGFTASAKPVSITWESVQPEDMDRLHVAEGGRVLEVCRVRLCADEPVMLETNRFPESFAYLEHQDLTVSLYDLLGKHGTVPSHAVHDITLGYATPLVDKHLGTSPGEAMLILDETVLDQNGRPIHTSHQWIRGDKFTFRI